MMFPRYKALNLNLVLSEADTPEDSVKPRFERCNCHFP